MQGGQGETGWRRPKKPAVLAAQAALSPMNSDFSEKNTASNRRILWNSKNDLGGSIPISNHYLPLKENSKRECMWHSSSFRVLQLTWAGHEGAGNLKNNPQFCLLVALGLLGETEDPMLV